MQQDVQLLAAPAALTARRRPLHALTGIRFFAAIFVVVFHTRASATLKEHGLIAAGNFFANGYLAVPLFFLLSGFILAYTYEGQIERRGDHRRFWEARFARIWPVYALSLLLSSIPSFTFPPLPNALAALFMVQAWNPWRPDIAGTWNFVCWTLSVEALFYIVFPWLQVWLERQTRRTQILWITLMLTVAVVCNTGSYTLGNMPPGIGIWIPRPVIHLPEFFIGVGMGNLYLTLLARNTGAPILPGKGIWTYLSALAAIALLCREPGRWTSLVVVAFALLLFGLAAETTLLARFLSTRVMLLGGGISYSIYLMQLPVKGWVIALADAVGLKSDPARMGLTFATLLLVSFILFKTVEEPARRLLRSVFARMEQRRASTEN
jgi:peptidoglycan/LPS O-acetylase OafA/YrhL